MALHFENELPATDQHLPDFGAPPVVEMSVGVQFEGLTGYNSLLVGEYRSRVLKDYPVIEEHPPLEPAFETFGSHDSSFVGARVELVTSAIQPRFFMLNDNGSELIQLQRDRLYFNWRRQSIDVPYPRYPYLRGRFQDALSHLRPWSSTVGAGTPVPTQCEVVYVNHIPLKADDGQPCGLSHILPWLAGLKGMTEDGSFQFRRRLLDDNDEPVARFTLSLRYGGDVQGDRQAQLILMVRGRPAEPTDEACLSMIDDGRRIIVHNFADITSPSAHTFWEKN